MSSRWLAVVAMGVAATSMASAAAPPPPPPLQIHLTFYGGSGQQCNGDVVPPQHVSYGDGTPFYNLETPNATVFSNGDITCETLLRTLQPLRRDGKICMSPYNTPQSAWIEVGNWLAAGHNGFVYQPAVTPSNYTINSFSIDGCSGGGGSAQVTLQTGDSCAFNHLEYSCLYSSMLEWTWIYNSEKQVQEIEYSLTPSQFHGTNTAIFGIGACKAGSGKTLAYGDNGDLVFEQGQWNTLLQFGPTPTLAAYQMANVPNYRQWLWRVENVTLTLTPSADITLGNFVVGVPEAAHCDSWSYAINRSAPVTDQLALPVHVGGFGWTGYKTASLSLNEVSSTPCGQELSVLESPRSTGEAPGGDLGCTRKCLSSYQVLEIYSNSASPSGYIALIPTFRPDANSIVPACFCPMAIGGVTVPQHTVTPLAPDTSGDDLGKTTPQISSTVYFGDSVAAQLVSSGHSIQMQINPWENTRVAWGPLYTGFKALSHLQCTLTYGINDGGVVLGTTPPQSHAGAIGGGVAAGVVLLVILVLLYVKSPRVRAALERGVASIDRTLNDLDEHTKPYTRSRAHLPQAGLLLLAAILLFVGMFTNSVVVYYSPPWTRIQSGASVGIWWVDLDASNVLAPDVNQVVDCYFYTVSDNVDSQPFYYEHDLKYVHTCQAAKTFSVLLVFVAVATIATAVVGLRRITTFLTATSFTFALIMLLVFVNGLALPFYNRRLEENHENTNAWTVRVGSSFNLIVTAMVLYLVSGVLFARKAIGAGFRRLGSGALLSARGRADSRTDDDELLIEDGDSNGDAEVRGPGADLLLPPDVPQGEKCPSCGFVNKVGARFCASCGNSTMAVN